MLVDSGGKVSILKKDVFDDIPPSCKPLIKPVKMNLLTVNGGAT